MNYKATYLHIAQYLDSLNVIAKLTNLGLPPIAHVDLWKEQPKNEASELAYPLPAVFISFDETRYDDQGVGYDYDALTSLAFYLETQTWDSTALDAPNQETALEPLEMLDALIEILLDYQNPKGARLILQKSEYSSMRTNNVVSKIDCEIQTYNCS